VSVALLAVSFCFPLFGRASTVPPRMSAKFAWDLRDNLPQGTFKKVPSARLLSDRPKRGPLCAGRG